MAMEQVLYFVSTDNIWTNFWAAMETLGTIFAACVSLYLARCRPKERVSGEWYTLPIGAGLPEAIKICLKNNGRRNVELPDVLRIDLYLEDTHWGTLETPPQQNNFIPAKFSKYETSVQLPNGALQHIIQDQDVKIFTWTKAGARIELKHATILTGTAMPIQQNQRNTQ